MFRTRRSILIIFLSCILAICGEAISKDNSTTQSEKFNKDIRKRGCDLLTANLVSETFDIPANKLKQTKVQGCLYTWKNDTDKIEAHLSMIRAHKSSENATRWFANATRNKSLEEMQAERRKLIDQIDNSTTLKTDTQKALAKQMMALIEIEAEVFDDIPAIGDEARMSSDGTVFVRVENLTFNVAAYQGMTEPPVDLTNVSIDDMQAVAKKHSADWKLKTSEQRKKNSPELAKAIVNTL